jgi:formylglycine-generating enzyme required for sulfatase activity
MSGNVDEWCYEWQPSIIDGSPLGGANRIIRGGNWATSANSLQIGNVVNNSPSDIPVTNGFRPARTAP